MTVVNPIAFYDMLGIDPTLPPDQQDAEAAKLWPIDRINATEGYTIYISDGHQESLQIVRWLQGILTFDHVRPGADRDLVLGASSDPGAGAPGQITLSANFTVGGTAPAAVTLYLRDLPNVGIQLLPIQLLPTESDKLPTVFFAGDGRGYEVLIENLPVDLVLPPGMIQPEDPAALVDGSLTQFGVGDEDSLEIEKRRDPDSTVIRTHVRLHLRPDGDVILEPNTPVSVDGATLWNLPVEALHDLLLIPSPRRREYLEWARNDLASFVSNPPAPGAIAFRSITLAVDKDPLKGLVDRFRDNSGVHSAHVDLVLEDLVLPVTAGVPVPIPSHGTFGLRRRITDRNDIAQAYSLTDAPFRLRIYTRGDVPSDTRGAYIFIDQLQFSSGSTKSEADQAPVLELQAGMYWDLQKGGTAGWTFGIGDDWTLQAGGTLGDASALTFMEIANVKVSIHAAHLGYRLRELGTNALFDIHSAQFLGDFSLRQVDSDSSFKVESVTGKPLSLVVRDVGWSFGHWTIGKSLAMPDGVQVTFGHSIHLIVEELGWIEEPNGGTYFSMSGGVAIGYGGGSNQPTSQRDDKSGNHVGIRFRRLRFLTSDPDKWKLDGIFVDIKFSKAQISGFGYISDETDSGYRYREFGFGVSVTVKALECVPKFAAEFIRGTRQSLTDATDEFGYLLGSLQVGFVPVGPVNFTAVRALFAYNMQPALDPPGQLGEGMVLYQWHKDHDAAIDMPRSRNLADWKPVESSFAVGAAAEFTLHSCGKLFHIDVFVLVTHSEPDTEILVVGDLYLLKNPEPVAFLAVDYDPTTEKFGALLGIDFELTKFLKGGDTIPDWLRHIARLSGTIYVGNKNWTVAIGQLADQRTWLGITFKAPWLALNVQFAVGLQIEDEGPKGFGLVFTVSGGKDAGIGAFIIFGSVALMIGPWKTASHAAGTELMVKLGFKIHLFYVFHFGADISVDIAFLGRHPFSALVTAKIHIDLGWFLPDVTFRFEEPIGHAQPFDNEILNPPLSSAGASIPAAVPGGGPAALLAPPLSDGNADPTALYTFNGLAAVTGAAVEDVHLRQDLPIVAVDADISIEFSNPVANDAAVATDTYTGGSDLGVQQSGDVTVRYALASIAIHRSPRFGPWAGTWTDLIAPNDTELDVTGGGTLHAVPAVSFQWDADCRADGLLSPRRLLINSRTPYSLTLGSSQNDQQAVAGDPGFPCCGRTKPPPVRWHTIDFVLMMAGLRLAPSERFSDDGDWWHWTQAPVTINGFGTLAGVVSAFVPASATGITGSVDFSEPVRTTYLIIDGSGVAGTHTVEAYRGLALVDTKTIDAATTGEVSLSAPVNAGMTRVVIRAHPAPDTSANPTPHGLQISAIAYLTCAEATYTIGRVARCGSHGTGGTTVGGAGKLAFLPNTDYVVTPTVTVTLSHRTGGAKTLTLTQPAYFRTKGLVGLNSVANVGDELRPYIASAYPQNNSFQLYREEPVALAFTEDMSSLLPVDRTAAPGDPPEKTQLMRLTLTVERVGSTEGLVRLSAADTDWLTAHGGPLPTPRPPFLSGVFTTALVRRAASLDPQVLRYENVLSATGCAVAAPLHSSQVLLHDPLASDGTTGAWDPQASMRATVRAQAAPYTERQRFVLADLGAITFLAQAPSAAVWTLADGVLVAPGGGRAYAAFGDPTWNHLVVQVELDRHGATSGVAVGVSGSNPVAQALLALIEDGALVVVSRQDGIDTEIARATVPETDGSLLLEVTAFDDRIRAQVGQVTVEADRGAVREGRVALVSDDAAGFYRLAVDGLALYQVPFTTSRYGTFAEHMADHQPTVAAHPSDGMGAAPTRTVAEVCADDAASIAGAMSPPADPQVRQTLFATILSDIGLPQLDRCDRVTLTRLLEAGMTTAILLESPEPISFLHDVTLSLTHHIRRFIPPPIPSPAPGELDAALAPPRRMPPPPVLRAPVPPPIPPEPEPPTIRPPVGPPVIPEPQPGTWIDADVVVATTLISNGTETSTLIIPASPLPAGTYTLALALERTRWETATADPQATYQDAATISLAW
jgi:hypothetical protein